MTTLKPVTENFTVKYVITADSPRDLIDGLHAHFKKLQESVMARQPGTTGIKKSASLAGEVSAFQTVLWFLEKLEVQGPLADAFAPKEEEASA